MSYWTRTMLTRVSFVLKQYHMADEQIRAHDLLHHSPFHRVILGRVEKNRLGIIGALPSRESCMCLSSMVYKSSQ